MLASKLLAASSGKPPGYEWAALYYRDNIYGVAYSSTQSLYIAVGENSCILYSSSSSASSWQQVQSPITDVFKSVVWTGTKFFAAGKTGQIIESTTGLTWSINGYTVPSMLGGVVQIIWTGSLLVALTEFGYVAISSDGGATWATYYTNLPSGKKIAWNGTAFVACGGSTSISRSTDAITWSLVSTGAPNFVTSVGTAGSRFVVGCYDGRCYTSTTSGSSWSSTGIISGGEEIVEIFNGGTYWIAVAYGSGSLGGYGRIYRSANNPPSTWTSISSYKNVLTTGAYFSSTGHYVVMGWASLTISTSSATSSWTIRNTGPYYDANSVATNGTDIVIACNQENVFKSTNGLTWTSYFVNSYNWKTIAWSSSIGKWVVGGTGPYSYSSTDAITWSIGSSFLNSYNEIFAFGNYFWLGTNDGLYYSTTGTSWTYRYGTYVVAISGKNVSNIVAAEFNNNVYYSINSGTTFTTVSSANSHEALGTNGTVFVLSKSLTTDKLYTSTDGSSWSVVYSGSLNDNFYAIANSPVNLVAAGGDNFYSASGTTSVVVLTEDAGAGSGTWTSATLNAKQPIYGCVYVSGIGKYIAVGHNGQIYVSPPPSPTSYTRNI